MWSTSTNRAVASQLNYLPLTTPTPPRYNRHLDINLIPKPIKEEEVPLPFKRYLDKTTVQNHNGYPHYRSHDNGSTFKKM